jgi:type 1 glutamine amidotransferase
MRHKCSTALLVALAAMFLASFALAAEPAAPGKAAAPKAAEKKAPPDAKPEEVAKAAEAMPDKPFVKPLKPRKLLIFTLCKGFPHSSVNLAAKSFEALGKKTGAWNSVITTDVSYFAPDKLKEFDAVMMDNTTGKDLIDDPALKQSLLDFVKSGKGIIGCHAATDAFYEKWPEYGEMMGGFFQGHPFYLISVKVDDTTSPLTAMFQGKGFEINDEIYTFKAPYSRDNLHILLSLDWPNTEAYAKSKDQKPNRADNDYALSWIRDYGKGRVFYCAFGHNHAIFWNPAVMKHYLAGIQYAMGDLKADATPSAKLTLQPARGPVIPPSTEKPKEPAKAPAPKVNKAPLVLHAPAAANDGWITLFDGKNLDAWQKPAADKWKIVDGIMTWEKGCGNIWTKEKFGDFIVDLEFKCTKGDKETKLPATNSGVFLRSVEGEKNWLQGSFEIQVAAPPGDGKAGKHSTGALYDCVAPSVFAEKPVGEWNRMVITFKGNSLKIVLNDKPIIDANLDDWKEAGLNPDGSKNKFKTAYKDMGKVGFIGLQDHGAQVKALN